ncbi:hypothetical protein TREMEDRAFT_29917, partial [Tremella mesenterica DSM 1558]|uniref:uncharacterized protein n=1 Tax=Tremella mesenterica (strain ATCC 24925 / CBS 8224 / DSM 1558 / NBRC 9311 / NRRL Y-6157 / RJB 2259-6 / UBC 559-6) TaxID=578456 RepID=UPI0003F49D1A
FGGLKVLDFKGNKLSSLPDSFADLLRLTTVDLSYNDFTSIPSSLLLLPALQVLDLSHNQITSINFSSPVEPSQDGLDYGAGFLSTSFSRAQNKGPLKIWPVLRNLNLGHNLIANEGLEPLCSTNLTSLRVFNLENNELSGELNLEKCGIIKEAMPELMSLNLNGNSSLQSTKGLLADGVKLDMVGCGISDVRSRRDGLKTNPSSSSSDPKTGMSIEANLPISKPTMTITYRTCPAATFDALPLNIEFDLYLPDKPGTTPHPLVIWFHGGALLQGNKENLPPHFRRLPSYPLSGPNGEENVAVISPNHRLAPQIPILDILSDISALFTYVHTKLNDKIAKEGKQNVIDTRRICVSGGSTGGYLALIAGLSVSESLSDEVVGGYRGESSKGGIKCLAPFYPITDLTHPFWSTETNPVPWYGKTRVSHEEARPHLDLKAAPVCTAISGGPRSVLYAYMLQHALFPSLLFQKQRSIGSSLDAFRPTPESLSILHRLELCEKARKKVGQPPVYLCYGTVDDKVQPQEKTVEVFKRIISDFTLDVKEGGDHAFDEDANVECLEFRSWLEKKLL